MKPMAEHFAGDPERFYAKGGSVQLAGAIVFSFKPSTSEKAVEGDEAKAVEPAVEPSVEAKAEGEETKGAYDAEVVEANPADKELFPSLKQEDEVALEEIKVSTPKETESAPNAWLCCTAKP